MQEVDMVLNLHGEIPSDPSTNVCVLNAESSLLPHLVKLHARFPRLRIVLEHATTRAAVECVKSLGSSVACTITAHHLALIVDDWAGQSFHFCKPVAKFPDDRQALRDVIKEGKQLYQKSSSSFFHFEKSLTHTSRSLGHPRFFLGSDSARHCGVGPCRCRLGSSDWPFCLASAWCTGRRPWPKSKNSPSI